MSTSDHGMITCRSLPFEVHWGNSDCSIFLFAFSVSFANTSTSRIFLCKIQTLYFHDPDQSIYVIKIPIFSRIPAVSMVRRRAKHSAVTRACVLFNKCQHMVSVDGDAGIREIIEAVVIVLLFACCVLRPSSSLVRHFCIEEACRPFDLSTGQGALEPIVVGVNGVAFSLMRPIC